MRLTSSAAKHIVQDTPSLVSRNERGMCSSCVVKLTLLHSFFHLPLQTPASTHPGLPDCRSRFVLLAHSYFRPVQGILKLLNIWADTKTESTWSLPATPMWPGIQHSSFTSNGLSRLLLVLQLIGIKEYFIFFTPASRDEL